MLMNFTPDHGSTGGTHTNIKSYRSLRSRRTARRARPKNGRGERSFPLDAKSYLLFNYLNEKR